MKSVLRHKVNSFKVEMSLVTDGGVHGLAAFSQCNLFLLRERDRTSSESLRNHFSSAFGSAARCHPHKQRGWTANGSHMFQMFNDWT